MKKPIKWVLFFLLYNILGIGLFWCAKHGASAKELALVDIAFLITGSIWVAIGVRA